jgi:hypothetical protein
MLRSTQTLFLCLIVVIPFFAPVSYAWTPAQAASQGHHETADALCLRRRLTRPIKKR